MVFVFASIHGCFPTICLLRTRSINTVLPFGNVLMPFRWNWILTLELSEPRNSLDVKFDPSNFLPPYTYQFLEELSFILEYDSDFQIVQIPK